VKSKILKETGMNKSTKQKILEAIDKGIITAQDDYFKAFQSDISSNYVHEYFMTVYIFQSLLGLINDQSLALERPFRGLFPEKWEGLKPNEQLLGSCLCDLVLWDSGDKPIVAIEVKKNAWDYYEDLIRRLSFLLNLGLEFSVFASCLYKEVNDNNLNEAKDDLKADMGISVKSATCSV